MFNGLNSFSYLFCKEERRKSFVSNIVITSIRNGKTNLDPLLPSHSSERLQSTTDDSEGQVGVVRIVVSGEENFLLADNLECLVGGDVAAGGVIAGTSGEQTTELSGELSEGDSFVVAVGRRDVEVWPVLADGIVEVEFALKKNITLSKKGR